MNTKEQYTMSEHEPEWAIAWGYFPDPVLLDEETGEVLEYMGSRRCADGNLWHCFGHRHHPVAKARTMCFVQASPEWREPLRRINIHETPRGEV